MEYRALVRRCREQLASTGCAVVPGFLTPEGLARMKAEGERLGPGAHFNQTHTNPYNCADDPDLPDDHPQRIFNDRTNGFVAGDMIGPDTAIRRLFHDARVQAFVADCLEVKRVYEYADPLADLVINVLRPGCQHPWHFDTNEFIVTILTRESESGGRFEYCPGIRSPRDENLEGVSRVLHGDRGPVQELDLRPGDLQLFFGRFSLHRVTRVTGSEERHTVILGYTKEPGVVGKPQRTRTLFGRVTAEHEAAAARAADRPDALAD